MVISTPLSPASRNRCRCTIRGKTKAEISVSEPLASRITRSMAALLSVAVRKVAMLSGWSATYTTPTLSTSSMHFPVSVRATIMRW